MAKTHTGLYLTGSGSHVTGNDITWPAATRSDPEVTSFARKWPGEGCRMLRTRVLGAFQLLQGCNSQEVTVT